MSPRKRFIIFLTVLIGIVLLLMLIFGRGTNNNAKDTDKPAPVKPVVLTDYADTNSYVVLTVGGRVNGDDTHRQIRITVSPDNRQVDIIQGYGNNVIDSRSYPNNRSAYDTFIRSINRANFGTERKTSDTDDRGVCPTGQRYIYEVYEDNKQVSRTWAGSCTKGTSQAVSPLVLQLFRAQITDYGKFTNNVSL
jgi:hypothetical protein